MNKSFDLGLRKNGFTYGSFSGTVDFEWDEIGQCHVVESIILDPNEKDGDELVLLRGPGLFQLLEPALIDAFQDNPDIQAMYRRTKELGYGHLQHERA